MVSCYSNNRQASLLWDLETMLDPKHPLFKLANMVNWSCFEEAFAPLFCSDNGRPPKPIRLMVGLLMLKHLRNVSDELIDYCHKVAKAEGTKVRQSYTREVKELKLTQRFRGKEHKKYEFGNKVSIVRLWNGIIIGALSFRNEYDRHTIDKAKEQVDRIYGRKVKYLAGDRGYRGQQTSGETEILIPHVPKAADSAYTKAKKHKLFRKRAGIEPVIGHCKSDHRLGRNFYKGLFGDSVNVMLAAAAFNLKRVLRALLALIQRWMILFLDWLEGFIEGSDRLTCTRV